MNQPTWRYLRATFPDHYATDESAFFDWPLSVNTIDQAAEYFKKHSWELLYSVFGAKKIHTADGDHQTLIDFVTFYFDLVEWEKVGIFMAMKSDHVLKSRPQQSLIIIEVEEALKARRDRE